jgi:hypothetical protein
MTRVQIPAYTDAWMKGDRFGEIVKVTKSRKRALRSGVGPVTVEREIAHVKLDKSGKTVRVVLADCEGIA